MKTLPRTQFGDPVLRKVTQHVKIESIKSRTIQQLIKNMRHTLLEEKIGIGLAAPQVGKSLALAVIAIRPSERRPRVKDFDLVLINPKIVELDDQKKVLWEGCISGGSMGKADLFAKVPRSTKIIVTYYDETGVKHTRAFTGLRAQVVQHEVDHLNGVLFIDRVKDTNHS
jgi:peptide deformylase